MAVTLLFTDIESSTRLVEQLGPSWSDVLERHRVLVRAAVMDAGGRELDCPGDAMSSAFDDARAAVDAAVALQIALAQERWPDGAAVRVRTGIHTGAPTPTGTGYVGLDVHRAARICEAGHGGQVLVSAATHALLDGVETEDLGVYSLRGIPLPERIYQLVAPGLAREVRTSGRSACYPMATG